MTAVSAAKRTTTTTTFTIDEQTGLPQEEAAAATATPFDSLANEKDLALPIAAWPSERIWERIQGIGDAAKPEAEPRSRRLTGRPRWRGEAKSARQGRGGPAQQRTRPNPIAAARTQQATPPRGGSKTAQVVATPGPGPIYSGIVDQPAFGRLRH